MAGGIILHHPLKYCGRECRRSTEGRNPVGNTKSEEQSQLALFSRSGILGKQNVRSVTCSIQSGRTQNPALCASIPRVGEPAGPPHAYRSTVFMFQEKPL